MSSQWRKYVLCLSSLSLFSVLCLAQTKEKPSGLERPDQLSLPTLTGKEDLADKLRVQPMEGPVDPDVYVLGPSDVVQVSLWGPIPLSFALTVTPEGTLIIPTVGEIRVADQKLAASKRKVIEAVKRKYPMGDATVTLIKPRTFIVSLQGVVLKPGNYVASGTERVERIINEGAAVQYPYPSLSIPAISSPGGLPLREEEINVPKLKQSTLLYERASTRNILLIRRNRDTMRVDIPKFYATGEERHNPFLRDGDVILVPQKLIQRNFVAIHGAVNAPGVYEYAEGDSIIDLLRIAKGWLITADLENVVISRLNQQGKLVEEIPANVRLILEGKAPNVAIGRGDRILVRHIPDQRRNYQVMVAGEVTSPGTYPITYANTRLSEVIKQAGGFTPYALLSGSMILRRDQKLIDEDVDPQIEFLNNLRSHQLSLGDSVYFFEGLKIAHDPVVVNLEKLFAAQDTSYDITLRNGDVIYVPSNQNTILVQGQVANPGHVAYVAGADYRYYIQKAGGYSELAVPGDTRVIKNGTYDWVKPDETVLKPGDQIWVPKEPIKNFQYYFSLVREVSQIVSGIAVTGYFIALILGLPK